jgi:hypothetical protein
MRLAACSALLWLLISLALSCAAPPLHKPRLSKPEPVQNDARPKRCAHRTWAEERGVATLATGVTFNAVMVWPAEQLDLYVADLEREVEAYRRAPWCGGQHGR